MSIRIEYVDPSTRQSRSVIIDGATPTAAVAWLARNVPGVRIFRASMVR